MIMRLWEMWGAGLGQRVAGSWCSLSGRDGMKKWAVRKWMGKRKLDGGMRERGVPNATLRSSTRPLRIIYHICQHLHSL